MSAHGALPFAPAAERNKQPILEVLQARLPEHGLVLEIGSGTGQHIVHFAAALPGLQWQASERERNLPGLRARLEAAGLGNLRPPLVLDVQSKHWPAINPVAVYAANVAHIMSWQAVLMMLRNSAALLAADGQLLLYGPFHRAGQPTSAGNAAFDASLRSPDNPDGTHQGIRNDQDVFQAAAQVGLLPEADIDMPANNRILVFIKSS